MSKLLHIAAGFGRAGIFGFGGGVVCLPLIQREAVDKYGWITNEEFVEITAISNTLPGPINTKMAGYIGYRVAGTTGAAVAVAATILPSAITLVLLLETISRFRDHPIVAGMTAAILPVVGVMLGLMVLQFLKGAAKGMTTFWISINVLIAAALTLVLGVHPALIVIFMILLALFQPQPQEESK